MHLPIKAICDPRTRKDATNLISIQYCHSPEKRTVLPVNIHIPIAYWNTKQRLISNKLPVSFGDANELNQSLLKMIRRAEDLVFLAKETKCKDPIQILEEHFYLELSIEDIKKNKNQSRQIEGIRNIS